jgi:hypothetical protein
MYSKQDQEERIETRIDMIRKESRILSYKIERIQLQDEKRNWIELLDNLNSDTEEALKSLQNAADKFLTKKNK